MLFYRPLLSAYQEARLPRVRQYLLRDMTDLHLHSEPAEQLLCLRRVPGDSVTADAQRMVAEVRLSERLLHRRLSARSPSQTVGLWTSITQAREFEGWRRGATASPRLAAHAGALLAGAVRTILSRAAGADRALALMSLGDLGAEHWFQLLGGELAHGSQPEAAAIALARNGTDAAAGVLELGVRKRTVEECSSWLGSVVAQMMAPRMLGPVETLSASTRTLDREQAAIALEAFGAEDIQPLLLHFREESDPIVRLHLLLSLVRISVPPGMAALQALCRAEDAELLQVTAMRAAGRVGTGDARTFLEERLTDGAPPVKAAALESLACMGTPGEGLFAVARDALAVEHGRLPLVGLLALVVWKPEEAFERAVRMLKEPDAKKWCIAVYAMRYLNTDQTAPVLLHLLKVSQKEELQEIVVSALCRHLHRPLVLETLMTRLKAGVSLRVAERILTDVPRHVTAVQAPQAADSVRGMLTGRGTSEFTSSLLAALGSLGTRRDLLTLASFAQSEGAMGAVSGMELLADPAARETLDSLARSADADVREAAMVALFRLGSPSAVGYLEAEALAGNIATASRALFDMALSVRLAANMSRLAPLKSWLQPESGGSPAGGPGLEASGERPPATDAQLRDVLSLPRPTLKVPVLVDLPAQPPQQGTGEVYRDLGTHLLAQELAPPTTRWYQLAGLFAALVVVLYVVQVVWAPLATDAEVRRGPPLEIRHLTAPPEPLHAGTVVRGSAAAPVELAAGTAPDRVRVMGSLAVDRVGHRTSGAFDLKGRLLTGTLHLELHRHGRVSVDGAGTVIMVEDGQVDLNLTGDMLQVKVTSGTAQLMKGRSVQRVIKAGETKTCRAGEMTP